MAAHSSAEFLSAGAQSNDFGAQVVVRGCRALHRRERRAHFVPSHRAEFAVVVDRDRDHARGNVAPRQRRIEFRRLGAQPPTPEGGALLAAGRNYLETAPWLAIFPGLCLTLAVVGANLLGDGLRDALDPYRKL